MAVTKGRQAITQLTSSGTSAALDVSTTFGLVALLKHSNGSGSVSTPASLGVEAKTQGGTLWFRLATPVASTVAGQVDDVAVAIPDGVASVRVVYAAPSGPSGATLDAEVGTVAN